MIYIYTELYYIFICLYVRQVHYFLFQNNRVHYIITPANTEKPHNTVIRCHWFWLM